MNLPTRKEWEESGFTVPDELCSSETIKANARTRATMVHSLQLELATIKAERDELRNALDACVERLIASQPPAGGRTEAVINQAKAVLAKGKG